LFSGFQNDVFSGTVFFGSGRSVVGLTHGIQSPFPANKNGIAASFLDPITYVDVYVHASRTGSFATMSAFSIDNNLLNTFKVFQPDSFKGRIEASFAEPVARLEWISSEPNSTPVGIRDFSYFSIATDTPEPELPLPPSTNYDCLRC